MSGKKGVLIMPPDIILRPGTKVQVQWPWLREHDSYGVVKSYDPELEGYFVELTRTEPPYGGQYRREELVVVD